MRPSWFEERSGRRAATSSRSLPNQEALAGRIERVFDLERDRPDSRRIQETVLPPGRSPERGPTQVVQVRDVERMIENEGWRLVRTRGSHRQYQHPFRPGLVTIPGRPSAELAAGTLSSILKQAGLKKGRKP